MGDSTLVYMCVFHNPFYLNLLKLLMASIRFNVANIEKYTFLVLTASDFKDEVDSISALVGIPIRVHVLDIHSFFHSSAAKCRIFEYPAIDEFSHILYIDTDILIQKDLSGIFANIPSDDKLYAVEDGILSHPGNGGWYFTPETCASPETTPAVNAGVLAFCNTPHIRSVFEECCEFMFSTEKKGGEMPCCLEQPFINFVFYKRGSLDSQYMKKYVNCRPLHDASEHIVHFCAPIGDGFGKFVRMCKHFTDNAPRVLEPVHLDIKGKEFEWVVGSGVHIQFEESNVLTTPWGKGTYELCQDKSVLAVFAGHKHQLRFDDSSETFLSIRHGDCDIVRGGRR